MGNLNKYKNNNLSYKDQLLFIENERLGYFGL